MLLSKVLMGVIALLSAILPYEDNLPLLPSFFFFFFCHDRSTQQRLESLSWTPRFSELPEN